MGLHGQGGVIAGLDVSHAGFQAMTAARLEHHAARGSMSTHRNTRQTNPAPVFYFQGLWGFEPTIIPGEPFLLKILWIGTFQMINGYMSINEVAEKWKISPRRVRVLCTNGRIKGAAKLGREWAIPIDVERPEDKRIVSGEYRNWRKK